MLEKIGSYDAKTKLPEILRRVEKGESFTITNRGKAIADVIPTQTKKNVKVKAAIDNILSSKKHKLTDNGLKELKEGNRK